MMSGNLLYGKVLIPAVKPKDEVFVTPSGFRAVFLF